LSFFSARDEGFIGIYQDSEFIMVHSISPDGYELKIFLA
jgi:hypothetical protein